MFSVNLLYLFRDISVMFFCVFSGSASKASGAAAGDGYFFPGILFGFFLVLVSRVFWECFTSIRSSRKVRGRSSRASGRERARQ